jgi:hypothetical protein
MNRLCKAQRNVLKILIINHQISLSVIPFVISHASYHRKLSACQPTRKHFRVKILVTTCILSRGGVWCVQCYEIPPPTKKRRYLKQLDPWIDTDCRLSCEELGEGLVEMDIIRSKF